MKVRRRRRRVPAWVTDRVATPPGQRRVLLDLSPETIESLRDAVAEWCRPSDVTDPIERVLVEALDAVR